MSFFRQYILAPNIEQLCNLLSIYYLEFPKKHSKILAGIKDEEERGARRMRNFM